MTSFLTSKIGFVEKIEIYSYLFTNDLINQLEQLQKFTNWLIKSNDINLYELTENGFKVFQRMENESSWQYYFKSSIEILPPFDNTQRISSYISLIIQQFEI